MHKCLKSKDIERMYVHLAFINIGRNPEIA